MLVADHKWILSSNGQVRGKGHVARWEGMEEFLVQGVWWG